MNKETELSDKAIKDMHQYHYGVERHLKFALAVIAQQTANCAGAMTKIWRSSKRLRSPRC